MEVIWILLGGVYVYAVFVCFQKGKRVFGWLGLSAVTVYLAPFVVWFPIVGSLRPAKPGSQWERDHALPLVDAPPPPFPAQRSASPIDADEARLVSGFLDRAVDSGIVTSSTRDRLLDFLHAPATLPATPSVAVPTTTPTEAVTAPPARGQIKAPAPYPVAPSPSPRAPAPPAPPPPAAPQPAPQPPFPPPDRAAEAAGTRAAGLEQALQPMLQRLRTGWDSVSSEIALHGFSYLGVLLTFVGVLGFLLFAFQDVDDSVQPFVELTIVVVFFGWAWLLRRQQADNVANGMELLAGMILPLILFAGFVDGAPFPPNFTDGPLVAVLVITSLVLAVVYALVARQRPTTMLRFLVVPLVWLGALALGLAFKTDERLMGAAITRFVAVQPALAAVAIAASVTRWARHRLAARAVPVVKPALVAAPIVYVVAVVLAAGQEGPMAFSASLAGLATMITAYQLADHFRRPRPAQLAMPILLAGAMLPVAPSAGLGWAGAAAVAGYLMLIEWLLRRESPDRDGLLMAAAGLAIGLGLTFAEPLAAVVSFGTVTLWFHRRRVSGIPLDGSGDVLAAGAALAPFGFGWALWTYTAPGVALVGLAAVVAAAALVTRVTGTEDEFWELWPVGTATVVGLLAVGIHFAPPATVQLAEGAAIATVALAAATIAFGRTWPVIRLWLSGAFLVADVFFLLDSLNATPSTRAMTWAGLGIGAVAVAGAGRRRAWDHLALFGHLTATAALFVTSTPAAGAVVLSLWSAGWLFALVASGIDRGSLTRLLARSSQDLSEDFRWTAATVEWIVPVLLVASVPAAALSSLNLWGAFAANRSWTGVTLATLSVFYAAATRLPGVAGPLRRVLAVGAGVTVVLGVAIAAPDPWPTIAAAAASIAVALTLAAEVRQVAVSWFAWAMSGVMFTLLAERAGVLPHRLYLVVLAWGAVLFAGGLVADDVIAGRRSVGEGLRVAWTRFPVFLGALVVPVSLGPNFAAGSTIATWSAIGAAGAYGAVARLLKSPLPTLPAYGLGAFGFVLLTDISIVDEPMLLVGVAAALLVMAVIARLVVETESPDLWSAWDLPPLIVAHAVGGFALVVTAGQAEAIPWLAIAGLSAAVGVWRHRRFWFDAAHLIGLVGAAFIGTGGLIVGLALTTVRAWVELRRLRGLSRLVAQGVAVAAATAAWVLLTIWSEWDAETIVVATALAAGAGALIVGTLGRLEAIRRDTSIVWVGWSAAGMVAAAAWLGADPATVSTPGSHIAVAGGTVALAVAAQLLGPLLDRPAQLAAAPLTGLAWLAVATTPGWDPALLVAVTAVGFGALAVAVAVLSALERARPDTAAVWTGVAMAGVAFAAMVTFASPGMSTSGLRAAVAAGLALLAVAWHLLGRVFGEQARLGAIPLTGLAWLVVAFSPAWSIETAAVVSAWLGGAISIVPVELRRMRRDTDSPTTVSVSWAALGALLVGGALLVAVDLSGSSLWASGMAPGLALVGWAAGRGADPLRIAGLRHVSAWAALAAATCLTYGLGGGFGAVAVLAVAAALVGSAALVRMGPVEPDSSVWLRPIELFTLLAFVEAGGAAAALLPNTNAMAAVLIVAGLTVALLGVVRAAGTLMAVSPPLLVGGVMLLIADLATGSVQWYTLPIGLVVLAEVEITRLMIRPDAARTERDVIVLVEYAGIALLVLPAIVELFARSLATGAVAFAVAVGLMLWAILTRVRRRAVAAAVVAVGTAVLLISAALAGNAPDSAALWIVAGGLGFTVMSAAGVVEAARSRRGQAVRKIDELMGGWQ